MLGIFIYKKKKNNKRRFWVRPTLQKRNEQGVDKLLMNPQNYDVGLNGELRSSFKNFLRMSSQDFENLICLVGPAVKKKKTLIGDVLLVLLNAYH